MKKGWQFYKLGEITTKIGSGATPKGGHESYKEAGTPLIRSLNVYDSGFRVAGLAYLDDSQAKKLSNVTVQENDVLLNITGASVARCCVVPNDVIPARVNQHVAIIRVKPDLVNARFLSLLLTAKRYKDLLLHHGESGSTRQAITKLQLEEFEVALPPLPEQIRIVAILDEAFAGISQAVAHAEKNLANARELFDSYLNQVFIRNDEGWEESLLGDNIALLTGFAFKSKDYSASNDDVNLLRGDNIMQGNFRWEDVKKWPKSNVKGHEKYFLKENDIVLAMDRTWIKAGVKFSQVSATDLPCLLVQRVARLRVNQGLDSVFLNYLIGSKKFADYVLSIQTGLGVPHISGGQIQSFGFWKPALNKQQEIANVFQQLQEQINVLEKIYRRKLAALAELKQSLLQKAFTGELTASKS